LQPHLSLIFAERRIFILWFFSKNRKKQDGFAELLNYSHMVAPEVMGLKNGGFLSGFWLTGPDIESSTAQELEHLSEMMARTVNLLDTRWCIHFEFFRREAHNYPDGKFKETTTQLIDEERYLQFQKEGGHFESIQSIFITYVPSNFEKNRWFQRIKKFLFGSDSENDESIVEKRLERFEEVLRTLKDSLSLIMRVRRMTFHPARCIPRLR